MKTKINCAMDKKANSVFTTIDNVELNFVSYSDVHDIEFQKWTKDLSKPNSRPFHVRKLGRNYKTIDAAVTAFLKK